MAQSRPRRTPCPPALVCSSLSSHTHYPNFIPRAPRSQSCSHHPGPTANLRQPLIFLNSGSCLCRPIAGRSSPVLQTAAIVTPDAGDLHHSCSPIQHIHKGIPPVTEERSSAAVSVIPLRQHRSIVSFVSWVVDSILGLFQPASVVPFTTFPRLV